KSKYQVGQEVWYCDYHNSKGPIISENIISITLDDALFGDKEFWIKTESKDLPERLFYPTREALIDAQIEYWISLKVKEDKPIKQCPKCKQHRVSQGLCWVP